jgi:hypothetical protein
VWRKTTKNISNGARKSVNAERDGKSQPLSISNKIAGRALRFVFYDNSRLALRLTAVQAASAEQ